MKRRSFLRRLLLLPLVPMLARKLPQDLPQDLPKDPLLFGYLIVELKATLEAAGFSKKRIGNTIVYRPASSWPKEGYPYGI